MRRVCALIWSLLAAVGFGSVAWITAANAQTTSEQGVKAIAAPLAVDRVGAGDTRADGHDKESAPGSALLSADPAGARDRGNRPWEVQPSAEMYQQPFSRISVGAGVSPLGIGVNVATVLTKYFDARVAGNYFSFNAGRVEVDGFNVYAGVHLASATASLDVYPYNSPVRVSVGLMVFNQNHGSASLRIASGTSFSMNGTTYYADGLTGIANLAVHAIRPAPTLSFGMGKFVPRSSRHWSFPSEFGVAFTGTPTLNVGLTGTVCTDVKLTMCSNVADSSNPVGAEFNSDLQAKLANWRHDLGRFKISLLLSGGVQYSFDTPWAGRWNSKTSF